MSGKSFVRHEQSVVRIKVKVLTMTFKSAHDLVSWCLFDLTYLTLSLAQGHSTIHDHTGHLTIEPSQFCSYRQNRYIPSLRFRTLLPVCNAVLSSVFMICFFLQVSVQMSQCQWSILTALFKWANAIPLLYQY